MPQISAILITRNEEERLARCLESLRFADQIVVVDSGSTDATVAIAKSKGAEVFVEEWKGYTVQKNSALDKATGAWVVSLDGDEEFSAEAQADIRRLVARDDPETQGYAFRRKVFYLGRWIRHGDWYPDNVVRLWRRHAGRFEGGHVHESLQVKGRVKYLRSEILHYTYRDFADHRERARHYALLWARTQFERRRPFIWSDPCLRPPLRFLRAIVLKAGWLDGWRGLLIAGMSAWEVWLKYRALGRLWRDARAGN